MNTSNFYRNIKKEIGAPSIPLSELEEALSKFPYFKPLQWLHLSALNQSESVYYKNELKKVAIFSGDRELLHEFLTKAPEVKPVDFEEEEKSSLPKEEIVQQIDDDEKPESVEQTEKIPELDQLIVSHAIHASLEKEASEEIDEEEVFQEEASPKQKTSFLDWYESTKEKQAPKKKENKVVDQFLKEQPQIKIKKEFFSPVNMARQSLVESDDLVSETLAKIYHDQGNYEKAIEAYEKLSLKFPEKSSYFAGQIKKIKEKLS